jgi:hypothetical protein
LDGICPEAAEILKDKHLSVHAFGVLKKMAPLRQIEAAELMVAMNKYATSYAQSLLAATPQDQLVDRHRPKVIKGLRPEQVAMMEREPALCRRRVRPAGQVANRRALQASAGTKFLSFAPPPHNGRFRYRVVR